MTNEEAIEILKTERIFRNGSNSKVEAIDLAIKALEENSKLKAEIEQLKAELEQLVNEVKRKILSRRWIYTNDATPFEVLGMDWANKMNDWCVEIIEEAERHMKGKVSHE